MLHRIGRRIRESEWALANDSPNQEEADCQGGKAERSFKCQSRVYIEQKENIEMKLLGSWVNQNGSILTIEFEKHDIFSGDFVSSKGRAARGMTYPVIGVKNHDLVSFSVDFRTSGQDLRAISTFAGRVVPGAEPTIHTVWILAREFEDSEQTKPTHVWNTFITNSDVFTLQPEETD